MGRRRRKRSGRKEGGVTNDQQDVRQRRSLRGGWPAAAFLL